MEHVEQHYHNRIARTKAQLARLKKQISLASIVRLCSFLVLALSVYQLFHAVTLSTSILCLLGFIGFLASISWFVNLQEQYKALASLLEILENELTCLSAGINGFDNGSNWENGQSYFSDLDIFGKGSLYHYLNRTSTQYGSKSLAEHLQYPLAPTAILDMQSAVQTYGQQMELVESLIAVSKEKKSDLVNLDSVLFWLKSDNQFHAKKWLLILRYLIPFCNLLLLIQSITSGNPALLGLSFIIGWAIIASQGKYLQKGFQAFENKASLIKQYASVLEKFTKVHAGKSSLLASDQKTAAEAYLAIQALNRLTNSIDQRLNIFTMLVFNPYLLFDIQNMLALEDWKAKHKDHFKDWMDLIGRIELLNCFAVFQFQHPNYCFPILSERALYLAADQLTHPLIPSGQAVANDLSMGDPNKLWLVTGSNMSGKTTFLRAIGLNLVLAQAGLSVAAKNFVFSPMQIFSSIRISDSLAENTSYFMAELKKLQALKKGVQNAAGSLVLIDEILRGTNSEDKYHGSAAFIKELLALNCLSLFATHDLKLGLMEQEYPGLLANYCFESSIENNVLNFDYTIRKGIAQNKNASFLMKQMEII